MERITHAMRAQYWACVVKECNESGMKKEKADRLICLTAGFRSKYHLENTA